MGGATIELIGQKYNNEAIYNYVYLQSKTEGIETNPAYSTAPSHGDVFQSNAGLGKMVYTTEPIEDIISSQPPVDVSYNFWMEAVHNGAHNPIYCSGRKSGCTLTHSWAYTPFLYGVVPASFGAG